MAPKKPFNNRHKSGDGERAKKKQRVTAESEGESENYASQAAPAKAAVINVREFLGDAEW